MFKIDFINIVRTLPLFKCKMRSNNSRNCDHRWQITQKVKLIEKRQNIKAKQTEIGPHEGQMFTQLFLSHNHYFDRHAFTSIRRARLLFIH